MILSIWKLIIVTEIRTEVVSVGEWFKGKGHWGDSGVQEKCYVLTWIVFIWIKWLNSLSCSVAMLLYVNHTSIKTISILTFIMGKTYYERKEREYFIILIKWETFNSENSCIICLAVLLPRIYFSGWLAKDLLFLSLPRLPVSLLISVLIDTLSRAPEEKAKCWNLQLEGNVAFRRGQISGGFPKGRADMGILEQVICWGRGLWWSWEGVRAAGWGTERRWARRCAGLGSSLSLIPQRTPECEWGHKSCFIWRQEGWALSSLCLLIPGGLPCVPMSWCTQVCGNL